MAKSSSSASSASSSDYEYIVNLVWLGAALYGVGIFLSNAYAIRLQAIQEFGPVIHEFDPYFNWRATQYLYENGAKKFFTWFDHKVWYPLGRPVGSTIYPGMQFTAVYLKRYVFGDSMTLNDVCCYIPAWFGVAATCLVGCIAYEASLPQNSGGTIFGVVLDALWGRYANSKAMSGEGRSRILGLSSPSVECAAFAMGFMAVVPAHLMRSVGGGYDNESVAVTAMTLTFALWMRSLRNGDKHSHLLGPLTGLAYFYMVAAWGGYIFVLNLIGAHAAFLVLLGRFSHKVYMSYTLFYVVGTALAIQIPVVGWSPLKSLEQLPACAVFLGYQLLQYCEIQRKKRKLGRKDAFKLRVQVALMGLAAVVFVVMVATPSGYFGPISSRVRGLFVPHTKTGNPLVDSVAEHQAASNQAYWQYLHILCFLAPTGFFMVLFRFGDASSFLFVYAVTAYFFSHKMVRLVLLTAPIASTLGGIAVGRIVSWSVSVLLGESSEGEEVNNRKANKVNGESKKSDGKSKESKKKKEKKSSSSSNSGGLSGINAIYDGFAEASKSTEGKIVKAIAAVALLGSLYLQASTFKTYAWKISASLSNPSIILKGQTREGDIIKVDDYREAYWWIRDNTPEDARIMAWWDYGYQITGIANRTTIADGNTWNHEHIALLGKALTGSVEEGYAIARHLADYVLIWGGGGGDDLAKSPHLARIANSVYRDHCPGDVTCRAFGFVDRKGTPSAMMEKSFLYALHSHRLKPGVTADPEKFEPVYRSKYGKVRIYKILGISRKSKRWVEENRECDAGGWFCPGKYPPGLKEILDKKKDFAQLEDFNRGTSDEEYQKEYFENLNNPELARKRAEMKRKEEGLDEPNKKNEIPAKVKTLSDEEKVEIYSTWEDTEDTTLMWKVVNSNSVDDLERWLKADPGAAWLRSADGRGPMWWAFESKNQDIVTILMKMGVPHSDRDKNGLTPVDLLKE